MKKGDNAEQKDVKCLRNKHENCNEEQCQEEEEQKLKKKTKREAPAKNNVIKIKRR